MNNYSVVLLSGGMDSATCLAIAMSKGENCRCLYFDYRQRHKKELFAASAIAKKYRAGFIKISVKLPWSKSSLTDLSKKIPNFHLPSPQINTPYQVRDRLFEGRTVSRLPSTYVPGRNTIFIAYALSFAESIRAEKIYIGANAVDYSGYPDCRAEYFRAWNKLLASLGTKIKLAVPLLNLSKAEIITQGLELGAPYELTWSCYKGGKIPCDVCDSCVLRQKGFIEAGVVDPLMGN